MMPPRRWLALTLTLAACAGVTETEGGIGSLTLVLPSPAELEVGQAIVVRAIVQSADGDTLDTPVIWRVLDSTATMDSVTGRLSGVTPGAARVVARALDLYSQTVTFTVVPRVDTVVRVSPAVVTVVATASESPDLSTRLEAGTPRVPVAGRRLVYAVVSPTFSDTAQRSVEFQTGGLMAVPRSSASGTPQPMPRLRRLEGRKAPDSAIVEVTAYRPSGGPAVPGSGVRFIVRFATP